MKHLAQIFLLFILCTAVTSAQDLHSHSNAVSIANEANSTAGWSGGATLTADTTDPSNGNYAMKMVATSSSTSGRRAEYTFSVTNGETYDISIWAKVGATSTDPAFALWTGFSGFSTQVISGSTWSEYTFSLTANATSATIVAFTGSSSTGAGHELYIDRVSITPQSSGDTQTPSVPTGLQSTAQAQTTADLSWTASTDNVGVTGYRIYKDGTLEASPGNVTSAQVTGLTAGTTYSFTVSALDAAGNESTQSTAVSVTTDAASGGGSSVWTESGSTASYTGEVAIGTSAIPTGYKLAVEGKIRTREIRVDQDTWPDYVFEEDYDLPTLQEIQNHIEEYGHLPNIPSAKEVHANGMDVGEMNRLLLEKIEQLTLFAIQQQKEIKNLKTALLELQK